MFRARIGKDCLHNDVNMALALNEHSEGKGSLQDEHNGHVELANQVQGKKVLAECIDGKDCLLDDVELALALKNSMRARAERGVACRPLVIRVGLVIVL